MRTTTYFILIYSIVVFLSGIMAYMHANHPPGLYIEILLAAGLFTTNVFIILKKKPLYSAIALCLTLGLLVYYGYYFSIAYDYFAGALCGISLFIAIMIALKLLKISDSE